jgi:hypothetical protein
MMENIPISPTLIEAKTILAFRPSFRQGCTPKIDFCFSGMITTKSQLQKDIGALKVSLNVFEEIRHL